MSEGIGTVNDFMQFRSLGNACQIVLIHRYAGLIWQNCNVSSHDRQHSRCCKQRG